MLRDSLLKCMCAKSEGLGENINKKNGKSAAGLNNPESPVRELQGNEEMSDSSHLLLESLQRTLK